MLGQRATSNFVSVSGKTSQIIPRPVSVMLELKTNNKQKKKNSSRKYSHWTPEV